MLGHDLYFAAATGGLPSGLDFSPTCRRVVNITIGQISVNNKYIYPTTNNHIVFDCSYHGIWAPSTLCCPRCSENSGLWAERGPVNQGSSF